MNKKEARKIIASELETFRKKPFIELTNMVDAEPYAKTVTSKNGKAYQIEIQAIWDDKPDGNIRVLGSIDDGGIRAFFPLTEDFIKSPMDEIVGEL
jgi:hypothetical protein